MIIRDGPRQRDVYRDGPVVMHQRLCCAAEVRFREGLFHSYPYGYTA